MKSNLHPEYRPVNVTCACGQSYKTRSARNEDFNVDVCSNCHPYYTGKQKLLDVAGRVEKFRTKYKDQPARTPAKPAAEAKPAEAKPEGKKGEGKKAKAEKAEKAEKPAEAAEPAAKA